MMSQDQSKIHVISTSTIKVELESTTPRINLTPWDLQLLFIEYSQKGLLFHKPTPQQESTIIAKTGTTSLIHHLKASLERTLHFFPPLAGRLATTTSDDGATSCFFIDCNHEEGGALFIHATVEEDISLSVADILNSTYVPEIVRSFFPFDGVLNREGISRPLLAIQATELLDGLFIGCSINHLLVDGTSFWHFFNSWAEISRGHDRISKLPFFNRDQLNLDSAGSNSINISVEHLTLDNNADQAQSPRPPLKVKAFLFTKENIAKLKARANQEMSETSRGKVSSLQAVISHVWRSILRCRRFDNNSAADQETTFHVSMGARKRLNPQLLPEEYFGNAFFPGNVTLKVGKILENSLGWTAWQVNRVVASCNEPDKVKEFCKSWISKPKFLKSVGDLPSNYFIIVNSPRFNVYGNDFGWGKPAAARSGRSRSFDGRIIISQGLEEGSMEIEAYSLPETFSRLADDAEFMEFVTTKC